jgi:hypothetical protein
MTNYTVLAYGPMLYWHYWERRHLTGFPKIIAQGKAA